jgi:hypothetical protein
MFFAAVLSQILKEKIRVNAHDSDTLFVVVLVMFVIWSVLIFWQYHAMNRFSRMAYSMIFPYFSKYIDTQTLASLSQKMKHEKIDEMTFHLTEEKLLFSITGKVDFQTPHLPFVGYATTMENGIRIKAGFPLSFTSMLLVPIIPLYLSFKDKYSPSLFLAYLAVMLIYCTVYLIRKRRTFKIICDRLSE